MRHIAQAKRDRDNIEIIAGERDFLAIALHRQGHQAFVDHAVTPNTKHGAIDVGEYHLAGRADAFGEGQRQISGTAGNIQHAITRTCAALLDGKSLPDSMQSERHEVVHDVITLGDGMENLRDLARFFRFFDRLEAEMGSFTHGFLRLGVYLLLGRFSNAPGMGLTGSRLAPASFMRSR